MENTKPNLVQHALKFGLIMALFNILLQLSIYVINKELLVSFVVAAISIVMTVILVIYPVRVYRKQNNDVISFGEAFTIGVIIFAGSTLLTSVFQYLLYNVIDPELPEFIREKAMEKAIGMIEKFGGSQDDINKAIEQMEQQDFHQTPKTLGSNFLGGVLFGAVLSLIIAAFTRKKPKTQDIE